MVTCALPKQPRSPHFWLSGEPTGRPLRANLLRHGRRWKRGGAQQLHRSHRPGDCLFAAVMTLFRFAVLQVDQCAPTYFVLGDGGNEEGPEQYKMHDAVRVWATDDTR